MYYGGVHYATHQEKTTNKNSFPNHYCSFSLRKRHSEVLLGAIIHRPDAPKVLLVVNCSQAYYLLPFPPTYTVHMESIQSQLLPRPTDDCTF
jgi:hypothetical protein